MGAPEAVLEKVGSMPDVSAMSKDDLAALCKQLYDKSCVVFGEKFDEEYQVKKRDMEIHNLEMGTSESMTATAFLTTSTTMMIMTAFLTPRTSREDPALSPLALATAAPGVRSS